MGYHGDMRRAVLLLIIGVIAVATAAACGPAEPAATTAPTAAPVPQATTALQPAKAPAPTAEPRATPQPTATSSPVPTPQPVRQPRAQVGDIAPGFTLPSASGAEVSLESYRGVKNVALVYYRGSF